MLLTVVFVLVNMYMQRSCFKLSSHRMVKFKILRLDEGYKYLPDLVTGTYNLILIHKKLVFHNLC